MNKFVGLIILDGFGLNKSARGNAIKLAHPHNFEHYMSKYPHTTLCASGTEVGLPAGQIGNSEVGHLNIGAGRVVYQSLQKINNAIADKSFNNNEAIAKVFKHVNDNNSTLHIMGLLSDGGVHSHINHLIALLDSAKTHGVKRAFIHCFMDGRDTYRDSGTKYMQQLLDYIHGTPYKVATIMGRFYAMDRESNYDRTQRAYDAITKGAGTKSKKAISAIKDSYARGVYDEFIEPVVMDGYTPLASGDGIIYFNFREDRGRQLTSALVEKCPDVSQQKLRNILMCTFTCYDKSFKHPLVAFAKEDIDVNLSSVISAHGLRQFKVAETTKYAHVTYFLNGGIEQAYPGEDRYLVDTIKCASFDQTPAMRAREITELAINKINTKQYDFMCINYSNTDMIGHTGNLQAAIETVKIVDEELAKLVNAITGIGGIAMIIADHGNAEQMIDSKGNVLTDHTTNPVPCIIVSEPAMNIKLAKGGKLGNVAPTILQLMNISAPKEFTLPSLIK